MFILKPLNKAKIQINHINFDGHCWGQIHQFKFDRNLNTHTDGMPLYIYISGIKINLKYISDYGHHLTVMLTRPKKIF